MPGSHPVRWIILLCSALAAFGCAGTDTPQGATGSLSLDLVLAGGIEIDVVDWEITGNGMDMAGSVDVSGPGSTASVEVFGLPPGEEPYVVELSAISVDKEVTCRGSAEFDIEVGVSTEVMVMLNCKLPQELGAVRVNGKFNICAQLTKVVVSPLQTSVGNDISLFSTATDEEGDAIATLWSSGSGSLADPAAASTTYTCTEVGDDDITVLVTDDAGAYCMSMWTVRVTCVAGEGNPCDDVTCEDDGNECTDAACNPATGQCDTSNNTNACDGGNGTCNEGVCVPNPECVEAADCPDTGNECIDAVCNAGICGTSNNTNACDGGNGTCNEGVCVPNPECVEAADCPATGNECIDAVCDAGTCGTSNNTNACNDNTGTCNGAGECVPNAECVVNADCPATGNECIDAVCNAGTCGTSNNTNACNDNTGTCNAGECVPNAKVLYEQNFNLLDINGAFIGDGWRYFNFVFDSNGVDRFGGYSGNAPNGPQMCALVNDQGGPAQEPQQLSVYNDYNCCQPDIGHNNPTDVVQVNIFQEQTIAAEDVGKTIAFSFDAKRGNIAGSSTANAFIKTLDAGNQTNFVTQDTTNLPVTPEWNSFTITLDIIPELAGKTLQFGFQTNASNFESSGNYYDNVLVTVE